VSEEEILVACVLCPPSKRWRIKKGTALSDPLTEEEFDRLRKFFPVYSWRCPRRDHE